MQAVLAVMLRMALVQTMNYLKRLSVYREPRSTKRSMSEKQKSSFKAPKRKNKNKRLNNELYVAEDKARRLQDKLQDLAPKLDMIEHP